jgi:hypothetical protein
MVHFDKVLANKADAAMWNAKKRRAILRVFM